MGRVSGGTSISTAMLARMAVIPDRRLPHRVTALGDSRVAAIHNDPDRRVLSNRSPLNWANALLGQRMSLLDTFGVSGDRTDQMAARIDAVIATGAGLLYLQGGLNDIAQRHPSPDSSGAVAADTLITLADIAREAGMTVVMEAEVGSNSLDAGQVAQIGELNARLAAHVAITPGVHLHDARRAVLDPLAGDAGLLYRAGFSYDGVHPGGVGARAWGESLAVVLGALVPAGPSPLIANRSELPANGRRQLLLNPMMTLTTGGSDDTGGTVPACFVVERLGGATATLSTRADPDGMGNNTVIAAAFSAAGQQVLFKQDVLPAYYAPGDVVQAFALLELLDAPTGLSGLFLNLNQWNGTRGFDNMDLFGLDPVGPDQAMTLMLRTLPFTVRPGAGWLTAIVGAMAGRAGGAHYAVRQIGMRRLP